MLFRKKKTMQDTPGNEIDSTVEPRVNEPVAPETQEEAGATTAQEAVSELDRALGELAASKAEHAASHDKYMRLHAEFDNFRKRTAKERLELLQHAANDTLKALLPTLDDLERAIANNDKVEDLTAIREGFVLIHKKLQHTLQAQGLKIMEAKGSTFDPEVHEAIAQVPAPTPAEKGKVLDVVENGYTLHDKVVRYAKVVVGE